MVLLLLVGVLSGISPFHRAPPATQQQAAPVVAFWGDSLFEGFPRPPFASDGSDSVAGQFDLGYTPGTSYNGGAAGQSAAEIAIRQGGLPLHLQVDGGTIPASGTVIVRAVEVIGWRLDRAWAVEGSIQSVAGVLVRAGATLKFTRSNAGSATRVRSSALFVSKPGQTYRASTQVLLAGRNDIGYSSKAGAPADRTIAATRAMVDSLPVGRRVLVLGTITASWERRGTPGYHEVLRINSSLKSLYPANFWDYRSWLVHDAIYALGIEPTAEDLANMAADTVPPSIMVPGDGLHYSPATAAAAAARLHTELSARHWIS